MTRAEAFMGRALAEAARGRGRTSPNPMVGCLIARGTRVVAVGHHARVGTPHAEVVALRRAGEAARGADVYVTLEPCHHHGRTPPCTEALVRAGVRRVFVGMRDPNPIVNGRGIRYLRRHGIEVHVGVLRRECLDLNETFVHYVAHRRPFVVAKMAQSLDGRVATRTGESQWVTGAKARCFGHRLRAELDAIAVGVETVLADDPLLTCRQRGGRDPIRLIWDTHARTPIEAKVVRMARQSSAATWILAGERAPVRRVRALERAGVEVLRCPEAVSAERIDVERALALLAQREVCSMLVEGGPTLLGAFFDARLVQKVHAFVAPRFIGGSGARSVLGGLGVASLGETPQLERLEVQQLGEDWLFSGYPRWPATAD